MTWLSRLFPENASRQRLSDHGRLASHAQRRRRMANLESLEHRTLLSNVLVTVATNAMTGTHTLNIAGDTASDTFTVTENPNGTVTVTGTAKTLINGSHLALTPPEIITNIYINLPSSQHGGNSDDVTLTGTGTGQNIWVVAPGFSTISPGAAINLTVTGLHNSGFLDVYDAPTTGTGPHVITPAFSPPGYVFPTDLKMNAVNYLGGTLKATVTNSQFTSLLIEQTGCCPANVTLTGDTIPGNVNVYEGVSGSAHDNNGGNGADLITVADVKFGPTILYQFYGPQLGGACDGHGDTINVNQTPGISGTSYIQSLRLYQEGLEGGFIDVGTSFEVEVSSTAAGIYAEQGPGGGNLVHIESITVYGRPSDSTRTGPPSIDINQGDGGEDSAFVDSSTVYGDIKIWQGNGNGDIVHVANDVAGLILSIGPFFYDFHGTLYIRQGDGSGDLVVVDSNGSEPGVNSTGSIFNNVYIRQGNGGGSTLGTCAGFTGYDDVVIFDEATVYSDLIIIQNSAYDEEAAPGVDPSTLGGGGDGFNLVEIGMADTSPFGPATGAVSVGERTSILQGGANNSVYLGGTDDPSGIDFETTYLDIYTGSGGGGLVQATHTFVDNGSFFNLNYVINGGGLGNVYIDGGGNYPSPLPYSSNYSG